MKVGFMVRCTCGNQQITEIKSRGEEFDITEGFDSHLFVTIRDYADYLDIVCTRCGEVAVITI